MSFKRQLEHALSIPQDNDTEEGAKERTLWKRRRLFGSYSATQSKVQPDVVTDAYMESKIYDARFYKQKLLEIINRHASNALNYIVQACIDPSNWETIQPATTLAAPSSVAFQCSDCWAYFKIQVCNAVGGNAALVEAYGAGMTP
jgi:hypothetical protein